jgi:hypothetical protein
MSGIGAKRVGRGRPMTTSRSKDADGERLWRAMSVDFPLSHDNGEEHAPEGTAPTVAA